MLYDFVIIGAGIAGSSITYFLKEKSRKNRNNLKLLVVDKVGICQKASNAAGAFLFPKVGFNTKYTKFVNEALIFAFQFYEKIGVNTHKEGVLILPRDEKDILKFKEYKKSFQLKYKEKGEGFFFNDGGFVDSEKTCQKLLEGIEFQKIEIIDIVKKDNYFILNDSIKTKNIVLATGWEDLLKIDYIKIRPVWGQRIEIKTDIKPEFNYHKNCSVSKNIDGVVKIGATHERRWSEKIADSENNKILLEKASEILDIDGEIISMKAGMRAGSIDYFPIIGKVIDSKESLKQYPKIVKGEIPKGELCYKEGIFIINGGGGRGFSNYLYSADFLSDYILFNTPLPEFLDTKRIFIKWARRLENN